MVRVLKGQVDVLLDGEVVPARYAGSMRGRRVVVGDRARVRPGRRPGESARVVERLERRTSFLRTPDDSDGAERVVVANADQVVAMVAADHLQGAGGFLDRVLVAASAGGLEGLVAVNKVDLLARGAAQGPVLELARRYQTLGLPVVPTSAVTGEGLEELHRWLEGRWTVLSGRSGVGKTSLCNRLVPEAQGRVGELGRHGGRHTTAGVEALPLPGGEGAWVVDTPGVRSFGLGTLAPQELRDHFPELAGLDCELRDCLHDGEPGCRVADLGPDRLDPARLDSYRRLLAGLRGARR